MSVNFSCVRNAIGSGNIAIVLVDTLRLLVCLYSTWYRIFSISMIVNVDLLTSRGIMMGFLILALFVKRMYSASDCACFMCSVTLVRVERMLSNVWGQGAYEDEEDCDSAAMWRGMSPQT